jgi:hypothetical protein
MRWMTMLGLALAVFAGTGCAASNGRTYRLNYVPNAAIVIDGKLDEPAWALAEPLTSFTDPWRHGGQATSFRALRDDVNLYFVFVAEDSTPRYEKEWHGKGTLNGEDRVEIYFALEDKLGKYLCIEIDSAGRVSDFLGSFPRKWDGRWSMPGLKTSGRSTPTGYVVEGSIPLAALEAQGLPPLTPGHPWRMGLFRADLDNPGSDAVYWLTWIDPHTERPDFHTPGAYGLFVAGETKRVR